MTPIIIVSSDQKKIKSYIEDYIRRNYISPGFIFEISPQGKEISIEQIREIKKNVIYSNIKSQLFILFDFDKASYEAQNAFLKTLEEHPENIHFLLIVKIHYNLAPTVVSRSKVVILEGASRVNLDSKFTKKLTEFVEKPDLKILADRNFQAKEYNSNSYLFDKFITFFRLRITRDKKAVAILKETINLRMLVENNNVDPQNAVDYLLIRIAQTYQLAPTL